MPDAVRTWLSMLRHPSTYARELSVPVDVRTYARARSAWWVALPLCMLIGLVEFVLRHAHAPGVLAITGCLLWPLLSALSSLWMTRLSLSWFSIVIDARALFVLHTSFMVAFAPLVPWMHLSVEASLTDQFLRAHEERLTPLEALRTMLVSGVLRASPPAPVHVALWSDTRTLQVSGDADALLNALLSSAGHLVQVLIDLLLLGVITTYARMLAVRARAPLFRVISALTLGLYSSSLVASSVGLVVAYVLYLVW